MNPEETNFYHPGQAPGAAPAPETNQAPAAPTDSLTWTASEYIEHERGAGWYLMLFGGTIVFAGLTYFITRDFFATGIIIILGIIVGVFAGHKPRQMTYQLDSSGLQVGEKMYPYRAFKCFYLKREGSLPSINLMPVKRYAVDMGAYFEDKDYDKIMEILGEHLPYQEFENSPVNWLDRLILRLKL